METRASYADEENENTLHEIREEELREKFYQMPNMVDYMNLSPYAFRLYCHYKRVTGKKGVCWERVKTISKYCNMSAGMVTKARKELEENNLIIIKRRPSGNGSNLYLITIRDIWKENSEFVEPKDEVSPHERKDSLSERKDSPHETNNTTLNNTTINNTSLSEKELKPEPIREECDPDGITESMNLGYGGIHKKKLKKQPVHPAIEAYHSATGRYPRKELYPQIIEVVGNNPDVAFMHECFIEWLKISQNPSPYRWLFEWYKNGEIKTGLSSAEKRTPKRMAKDADGNWREV